MPYMPGLNPGSGTVRDCYTSRHDFSRNASAPARFRTNAALPTTRIMWDGSSDTALTPRASTDAQHEETPGPSGPLRDAVLHMTR